MYFQTLDEYLTTEIGENYTKPYIRNGQNMNQRNQDRDRFPR